MAQLEKYSDALDFVTNVHNDTVLLSMITESQDNNTFWNFHNTLG